MSLEEEKVVQEDLAVVEAQPMSLVSDIDLNQLVGIANNIIDAATVKPTFKEKLKSRKFWIAIAGIVVGIMALFGTGGSSVGLITFGIVEVGSILGYCISEGKIDAERTKQLLEAAAVIAGVAANPGGGLPEAADIVSESDDTQTVDSDAEVGYVDPVR